MTKIFTMLIIIVILFIVLSYVNLFQDKNIFILKFINKKINEQYQNYNNKLSSFIYPNINIDMIFDNFNNFIKKNNIVQLNKDVVKKNIYSSSNINDSDRKEIKYIINSVLYTINKYNKTFYKFMNIEYIYENINLDNSKIMEVILFINETNKYSTKKILLRYYKDLNKLLLIDIHTLQSNLKKVNNEKQYPYDNNEIKLLVNNWNFSSQLFLLKTLIETKNKNLISKLPINKINPYVNPTLFINNYNLS